MSLLVSEPGEVDLSTKQSKYLKLEIPGEDLVPKTPTFKPGLPGRIEFDGRPIKFEINGQQKTLSLKGTFLPEPLNIATTHMVIYCTERYPKVCERAIKNTETKQITICEGRLDVNNTQRDSKEMIGSAKAELDVPFWTLTKWTAGGVIVGGVIGFVMGYVVFVQ